MTEQMKAYANYPHLTEKDIKKLVKLDKELERDKQLIDEARRKGVDEVGLKKILIRNTNKKRDILNNTIARNISGIPKESWENFGNIVGKSNRSAIIVDFINLFLKKENEKLNI